MRSQHPERDDILRALLPLPTLDAATRTIEAPTVGNESCFEEHATGMLSPLFTRLLRNTKAGYGTELSHFNEYAARHACNPLFYERTISALLRVLLSTDLHTVLVSAGQKSNLKLLGF